MDRRDLNVMWYLGGKARTENHSLIHSFEPCILYELLFIRRNQEAWLQTGTRSLSANITKENPHPEYRGGPSASEDGKRGSVTGHRGRQVKVPEDVMVSV